MKDSKGISVLALVITIVVIVIITSITTYTGINMLEDSRKKTTSDKLIILADSLRKNDEFLNFDDGTIFLTKEQYKELGLEKYYDENYPVALTKTTITTADQKSIEYLLEAYKGADRTEKYVEHTYTRIVTLEKNIFYSEFDSKNGVNRPYLYSNMHAITKNNEIVEDVYADDWYDYNSTSANFAKMKYDTNNDGDIADEALTFVWIPRFAYYIQNYYDGVTNPSKAHISVPPSALQIVFLKDDSNYMSNNEVIPPGYTIHPAFRNNGRELPGFWIAVESFDAAANLSSAIMHSESLISDPDLNSHLMTNTEFSAALYLMLTTNSFDQIDFTSEDEFVAAGLESVGTLNSLEYADLYELDAASETGIVNKIGDALVETNWGRSSGDYPTATAPCIVRLLSLGYFDFTSVSASSSYHYRVVITNNV